MKKKLATIVSALFLLSILSACGLTSPATPTPAEPTPGPGTETPATPESPSDDMPAVTLVYAEVNPLESIVGQTGIAFRDKVAELSGGKITIQIQASGVLGSENDVLDTMLGGGGTIHMSRISAFALTSYGGQKSKLLSIPYTFVSRDHFWNFATSDLAPEFLLEPHENETGVRGLFYGEEGFRHFFTTTPVNGIEDLAGLKLRVSNDPVMNGMVNGLGASPTVVSFGELYSALQTGVVDGAEQPIANYKANAFQEVAPNLILDAHTLGAIQVIITDDAWDMLTPEQQDILMEAGAYASQFNRELSQDAEDEVLAGLIAEGVNVVEVADPAPWQAAVRAVVEAETAGFEELYQQLLDFAN